MPNVKWNQIPPLKGPDPQGIKAPVQQPKRFKTILSPKGSPRSVKLYGSF
jgi:hypothetical protein